MDDLEFINEMYGDDPYRSFSQEDLYTGLLDGSITRDIINSSPYLLMLELNNPEPVDKFFRREQEPVRRYFRSPDLKFYHFYLHGSNGWSNFCFDKALSIMESVSLNAFGMMWSSYFLTTKDNLFDKYDSEETTVIDSIDDPENLEFIYNKLFNETSYINQLNGTKLIRYQSRSHITTSYNPPEFLLSDKCNVPDDYFSMNNFYFELIDDLFEEGSARCVRIYTLGDNGDRLLKDTFKDINDDLIDLTYFHGIKKYSSTCPVSFAKIQDLISRLVITNVMITARDRMESDGFNPEKWKYFPQATLDFKFLWPGFEGTISHLYSPNIITEDTVLSDE